VLSNAPSVIVSLAQYITIPCIKRAQFHVFQ
jgi:hypothetical protein